jgi:hypothetical protein
MTVRKTAMRAAGLLMPPAMVASCGGGTAPAAAPSVSPATASTPSSPAGSARSQASQGNQDQGNQDQNQNQNQEQEQDQEQDQDQGSGQAVSAAGRSGVLPRYQPSTVLDQSPHHLRLRSSASVAEITAF